MGDEIDFSALADAALSRSESLVPAWLPGGHKRVAEWVALNPLRDDRSEGSFSVNLNTGRWGDFSSGDRGGDLVSLYAYLFCDGRMGEAAVMLADLLDMPQAVPKAAKAGKVRGRSAAVSSPEAVAAAAVPTKPKRTESPWHPVLPVPTEAPPPPEAHERRGRYEAFWTYRDAAGQVLGYVCRFVTSDGGKEVQPLTFCRHERTGHTAWRWMSFPQPRPLYGLDRLTAKPDAAVLVVEGEKCADAGQAELPDLVVLSWPGGGKAVDKADWAPLAGRKVITFADCDAQRPPLTKGQKEAGARAEDLPLLPAEKQPGVMAMAAVRRHLVDLGCQLWDVVIPEPGAVPPGYDIADEVEAGLRGEALRASIRERARRWHSPASAEPVPPPTPSGSTEAARAGEGGSAPPSDGGALPPEPPEEDGDDWRSGLLWNDSKHNWDDCLSNIYLVLRNHPAWRGVIGWCEFSMRALKLARPPYGGEPGEWEGADDTFAAMWLTQQPDIQMTPSSGRVAEAVEAAARANPVHPVRAYLRGLPPWDGVPRLDMWLIDCLGGADSPYARLVSRWFLMGMVGRVMLPGSKFDYCLVLEGTQGKGKSTALSILGGDWYADTDLDLHNKDAMASLQGVWLYEFPELGSLARTEALKQKSFLSRQKDKYRPVYGRRDITSPRQVVFAGSTNEWEWNKDPTGGRRFWPVLCEGEFRLDLLVANRDLLFAEALAAFDAGERYHPTREEQEELFDPEQLAREVPDGIVDYLYDWVNKQVAPFSMAQAIVEGMGLTPDKMTRDLQIRVGIALRKLGCLRVEKRLHTVRYWYEPPRVAKAMVKGGQVAETWTGAPVPLSQPPPTPPKDGHGYF